MNFDHSLLFVIVHWSRCVRSCSRCAADRLRYTRFLRFAYALFCVCWLIVCCSALFVAPADRLHLHCRTAFAAYRYAAAATFAFTLRFARVTPFMPFIPHVGFYRAFACHHAAVHALIFCRFCVALLRTCCRCRRYTAIRAVTPHVVPRYCVAGFSRIGGFCLRFCARLPRCTPRPDRFTHRTFPLRFAHTPARRSARLSLPRSFAFRSLHRTFCRRVRLRYCAFTFPTALPTHLPHWFAVACADRLSFCTPSHRLPFAIVHHAVARLRWILRCQYRFCMVDCRFTHPYAFTGCALPRVAFSRFRAIVRSACRLRSLPACHARVALPHTAAAFTFVTVYRALYAALDFARTRLPFPVAAHGLDARIVAGSLVRLLLPHTATPPTCVTLRLFRRLPYTLVARLLPFGSPAAVAVPRGSVCVATRCRTTPFMRFRLPRCRLARTAFWVSALRASRSCRCAAARAHADPRTRCCFTVLHSIGCVVRTRVPPLPRTAFWILLGSTLPRTRLLRRIPRRLRALYRLPLRVCSRVLCALRCLRQPLDGSPAPAFACLRVADRFYHAPFCRLPDRSLADQLFARFLLPPPHAPVRVRLPRVSGSVLRCRRCLVASFVCVYARCTLFVRWVHAAARFYGDRCRIFCDQSFTVARRRYRALPLPHCSAIACRYATPCRVLHVTVPVLPLQSQYGCVFTAHLPAVTALLLDTPVALRCLVALFLVTLRFTIVSAIFCVYVCYLYAFALCHLILNCRIRCSDRYHVTCVAVTVCCQLNFVTVRCPVPVPFDCRTTCRVCCCHRLCIYVADRCTVPLRFLRCPVRCLATAPVHAFCGSFLRLRVLRSYRDR